MDPTSFQAKMKNFRDDPCANSILQHFKTTFIEFNMHLVTMEMIATSTTHMDWTTPLTISSPFIMHLSLKFFSNAYNLNKKQLAKFMLVWHMLLNSYDNLTPINLFFP
jgi:hypothetical protein